MLAADLQTSACPLQDYTVYTIVGLSLVQLAQALCNMVEGDSNACWAHANQTTWKHAMFDKESTIKKAVLFDPYHTMQMVLQLQSLVEQCIDEHSAT